ncbi:MAG: hypothetical protein NZO58_13060, partial [Gemmataceae bacterium]|nr:hypothetical protein [Gemmataceae bacterium]
TASTRLVDLTTERSEELLPAPPPTYPPLPPGGLGHGTQCAVAAAVAAPQAEFVLIRVPTDDPYLLAQVRNYLRGAAVSTSLERRLDDLRLRGAILDARRQQLVQERRAILQNFRDEEEERHEFGFLGPVYGWVFSERQWHRQRMAHHESLERDLADRERRYWKLIEQIYGLKGINLVVCPRGWSDSYPLGGASPLGRSLDREPGGILWFQSAGNTAGQAWTGLFRDRDGNGVMEFAELNGPLPPGSWTSELNFLAWQPHGGPPTANLPENTTLRCSLQWREPHDPDYFLSEGGHDEYRKPLAPLTLVLLRQRDPDGKTVAADMFDLVARSRPLALRLDHQPTGSVYEQTLDYTITKPGRYAIRVETPPAAMWTLVKVQDRYFFEQRRGLTATSIRPLGAPTLPGLDKAWELRPRLFVDAVDPVSRLRGRPVLASFATVAGTIGSPADARSVICVGAADAKGQPRSYSARGAPPFIELTHKPTIWACDAVRQGAGPAWGTALAASFAAGTAAALLSAGEPLDRIAARLRSQAGKLFRAVP